MAGWIKMPLGMEVDLGPGDIVRWEPRSPPSKGGSTSNFGTPGPYHAPSYIRVRAVVWACGEGQTDTQSHRHTDGRNQYTFRLGYASREM